MHACFWLYYVLVALPDIHPTTVAKFREVFQIQWWPKRPAGYRSDSEIRHNGTLELLKPFNLTPKKPPLLGLLVSSDRPIQVDRGTSHIQPCWPALKG